jgi:hypothetical protein
MSLVVDGRGCGVSNGASLCHGHTACLAEAAEDGLHAYYFSIVPGLLETAQLTSRGQGAWILPAFLQQRQQTESNDGHFGTGIVGLC